MDEVKAALSPVTAVLEAAPGYGRVQPVVVVNPDNPGHNVPGDPVGASHILGPDGAAQPVGNIVGDGNRLVLRVKRNDADHRAEDFLLGHRHFLTHVGQYRRLNEVTLRIFHPLRALAAVGHPRSLIPGNLYVVQDAVIGRLRHHRPHLGLEVRRVANADGGHLFRQLAHKLVVDGAMHHGAGTLDASLPGGHKRGKSAAVDRILQVGVGKDDNRSLAAQFGLQRSEVAAGLLGHRPAGLGAAGQVQLAQARVRGQGLAGAGAKTVNDVQDAGRQPSLQGNVADFSGGQRRPLGGLEDYHAAGGQGRGQLLGGNHQGVVPRGQLAHHTQGHPHGVVEMARVSGYGGTLDFVAEPGKVAEVAGDHQHLGRGLGDRPPVGNGLHPAQFHPALFHNIGHPPENLAPVGVEHSSPGAMPKGLLRSSNGLGHILRPGVRHPGDGLPGGRVFHVKIVTATGGLPLAVDQQVVL